MIYKTLTVATFGLLAWQTVQLSNYREETTRVNYQLEMVLQDIDHIDEVSGKSQTLFKKQIESQEKLEKALLDQSEVLAGLGGGDAKSKGGKKKSAKKAPPKPQKLTLKESDELIKKLAKIEDLQKNKKKAEAVKALDEFKKAIWKLTKRVNVGKAKVLSISSSIDIVLRNWKTSDKAYPATIVKGKISAINTPPKAKGKPAPAKPTATKAKPKSAKLTAKKGKAPAGKLKKAAKPKKLDTAKKPEKPKKDAKAKNKDSKKDGSKKGSAKNMIQKEESDAQTS